MNVWVQDRFSRISEIWWRQIWESPKEVQRVAVMATAMVLLVLAAFDVSVCVSAVAIVVSSVCILAVVPSAIGDEGIVVAAMTAEVDTMPFLYADAVTRQNGNEAEVNTTDLEVNVEAPCDAATTADGDVNTTEVTAKTALCSATMENGAEMNTADLKVNVEAACGAAITADGDVNTTEVIAKTALCSVAMENGAEVNTADLDPEVNVGAACGAAATADGDVDTTKVTTKTAMFSCFVHCQTRTSTADVLPT